jgi:hypothetical protein
MYHRLVADARVSENVEDGARGEEALGLRLCVRRGRATV